MSRDSCDWTMPEFFSEVVRTARIERGCIECTAPILPGERYYAQSGKWDGDFQTFAQHLLCRDACVWIRDVLEGECVAFGELQQWWSDRRPYGGQLGKPMWRIGARMLAMIHRRERLA